ncbi:MAG: SWIM zinc finger family protein [Lentisphaeria bacterium]|jgi:hypothetical protein
MKSKIDEVVTASNLRSAAGSRSYSRGEEYFQRGAVRHFYCDGEQLTADVQGTRVYRARITNDKGRLKGDCNCPVGRGGDFCKHLVALGMTYLAKRKDAATEKNKSIFSWEEFLKKCDKGELIKIVLEMSPNNANVIERYRMTNLPVSRDDKLRELKSKVDELFSLAEELDEYYDDYWDDYEEDDSLAEFNEESELLLKALAQLAMQGEFELLLEASSYAIGRFLDSSNAEMDSVQEFVTGLVEPFLEAVRAQIKPNDEVLNLFLEWEGKGRNFGYSALSDILEELPDDIWEKWAIGALEKWRRYPRCQLGNHNYNDERGYVERHLLIWAEEHKNDCLKLEIMEKKTHCARDVIELAKEYHRQGMSEKVVPLLQKAYQTLGRNTAITDLLTEELQKAGDNAPALKLAWEEFTKEPMQDTALKRLQAVAGKMKCWPEYYRKALDFLEEQDKKESKRKSPPFYYFRDSMRQRRVKVLFAYGDQQAAWDLAQDSSLSEECWLELAAWRSKELPQEAAAVIKKLLDCALRPTGEDAYCHVIQLLQIYRKYLRMANCEAEFSAYCANIRLEYKRRRLLIKQMNAAKL